MGEGAHEFFVFAEVSGGVGDGAVAGGFKEIGYSAADAGFW